MNALLATTAVLSDPTWATLAAALGGALLAWGPVVYEGRRRDREALSASRREYGSRMRAEQGARLRPTYTAILDSVQRLCGIEVMAPFTFDGESAEQRSTRNSSGLNKAISNLEVALVIADIEPGTGEVVRAGRSVADAFSRWHSGYYKDPRYRDLQEIRQASQKLLDESAHTRRAIQAHLAELDKPPTAR